MGMELDAFLQGLSRLSSADLLSVAAAIDAAHSTAADEVEAWEDMMCIDDCLRRNGRSRVAARAAHDAVQAVRHATAHVGPTEAALDNTVVTHVAREAALFARALVAGEGADSAVAHLIAEWGPITAAA